MRYLLFVIAALIALVGMAGAANYMYEKASVKGVGYSSVEQIINLQPGYTSAKLIHKETGSGNVISNKVELEAERQLDGNYNKLPGDCQYWGNQSCPMDYINFTKEAEFEYMPVSYQTGTYDVKWIEKLCVQNYRIGSALTEMYTHAEHLQKTTEVKTRLYGADCVENCCTGVLEANINSNVIGVAHIGWVSKNPEADENLKGRHAEYGRSVEDMTGVFSIEKFIQLWGNSTCGAVSVDWLPCV